MRVLQAALLALAVAIVNGQLKSSSSYQCVQGPLANLAKGKNTAQSSTYQKWVSGLAADGDLATKPVGRIPTCTHTNTQTNPWWRVDLGSSKRIGTIILTNRGDCCGNRLANFQIRIGDTLDDKSGGLANAPIPTNTGSALFAQQAQGKSMAYFAQGMGGRYVYIRIVGTNRILSLCEVEIAEYCPESCYNLALNQPTNSSSVYSSTSGSANVVDGDTNNNQGSGSCFHSRYDDNPWLRVDLGMNRRISKVRITNRGDCCSGRLNRMEIYIGFDASGVRCTTDTSLQTIAGGATNDFDCSALNNQDSVSRYVYIRLNTPGGAKAYLQLCEVQVFENCDYSTYAINLARGKPAFQSSTCCSGVASRAVDGKTSSSYGKGGCTHTNREKTTWWYVDLGREYEISQVKLLNRGDCCGSRLSNFQIRIGNRIDNNGTTNAVCRTGQSVSQGKWKVAPCAFMRGRYVSIVKYNNDYLTLCEVQVYGRPAPNDGLGKNVSTNGNDPVYDVTQTVDGGIDTTLSKKTCTITKAVQNPYVAVDLGEERVVTSINFYFPSGSTYRSDVAKYAKVFLTNDPSTKTGHQVCLPTNFSDFGYKPSSGSFTLMCNKGVKPTNGRFVVLQMVGIRKLAVCEMNVVSQKKPTCNTVGKYGAGCRQTCPAGTGGYQCRKCPSGQAGRLGLFGYGNCIRPVGGANYPTPGTRLEFTDNCTGPSSLFIVANHGPLQHVYSKLCVLPENGGSPKPDLGSNLVLSNKCKSQYANVEINIVTGLAQMIAYPDICYGPNIKGKPKTGTLVTLATCQPRVSIPQAWDVVDSQINTWNLALNIKSNDQRFAYTSSYWGNPKFFGSPTSPLTTNSWLSTYSNFAINAFSVILGGKTMNVTLPRSMWGVYSLQELVLMGDMQLDAVSPSLQSTTNFFKQTYPSTIQSTSYCTNYGFGKRFYTGAQANMACQGLARIGVTTSNKMTYGPIQVTNGRCLHISGGGSRKVGLRNLLVYSGCDDSSRRLYYYLDTQGIWRQSRNGICLTTNTGKPTAGATIVTNDNCDKTKLFPWEYDPAKFIIRPKNSKLCVASKSSNPGNGVTLFLTSKCTGTSVSNFADYLFIWKSPNNRQPTACQQNKPNAAEGIGLSSGCTVIKGLASGIVQGGTTSFKGATVYVKGHARCLNKASCDPYMGSCNCAPGWAGLSCEKPCPTGRYGAQCSLTCNCLNKGSCDPITGKCTCAAGWTGGICNLPCPGDTTGVGCTPCKCYSPGSGMGAQSCDRFNGSCQCYAGWGGPGCGYQCNDVSKNGLASLRYKWGANCQSACVCSKANSVCDGVTGACKCSPGYRGSTCTQTCTVGTYGQDCAQPCKCQHKGQCDPINGKCTCTSGYFGSECQHQCLFSAPNFKCGLGCSKTCRCSTTQGVCDPSTCGCKQCFPGYRGSSCTLNCTVGTYGQDCAKKCACNNGICNNLDGSCICAPGWMGAKCNQRCTTGKWGSGCLNNCACVHGKCNPVDGTCSCDRGYAGLTCSGPCKNGFYGTDCLQNCGCDIRYVANTKSICNNLNGTCYCTTGYTGLCDTTCPKFKWGGTCNQTCNCNTKNSMGCNQRTGACDCKAGYTGADCSKACSTGRWGVNCAATCACHSHGSTCNAVNGTCNCNSGWTGATCAFRCPNGTWGANCANTCSCTLGGCDGVTGTCICPPGWTGTTCSQQCPTGFFGAGCTQTCMCVNGTCDKATGDCACFDGFTGQDCGQVCPAGKFGAGCAQLCPNCQNAQHATGSCLPRDGSCVCQPGWAGALCADTCPTGKFGVNCSMTCNCNGRGPCDGITGACVCNAGWTGPSCNQVCPANSYGKACASVCQCFNGATCMPKNGACQCAPGFYGPSCLSVCPKNHYGAGCLKLCNCSTTGTCRSTDGSCDCDAGYTGPRCAAVLSCPSGYFGPTCQGACQCQNGSCAVADGTCTCYAGFKGVSCEESCDPGYYGTLCASECKCENNGICSATDGSCSCLPGWLGALCNQACASGMWGAKCQNVCDCVGGNVCDKITGTCPAVISAQSSDDSSSSDTVKITVPIVVTLVAIAVIVLLAVWYTKRSVEQKMPSGVYAAEADDITYSAPGGGEGLENPTYAETGGQINATYVPENKISENPLPQ